MQEGEGQAARTGKKKSAKIEPSYETKRDLQLVLLPHRLSILFVFVAFEILFLDYDPNERRPKPVVIK